jgi:outer membrane protein TolC
MKRLHQTLLPLLVAGMAWGAEAQGPLPLTHRQALLLGASNLLQARIAREIREQIRQFPEAERGAFDWQLSASASNGKLAFGELNPRFSGLSNLYLTAMNTTEETRTASLGISKLDAIGGTINLNLNTGYNSFFNQVNSQTLPFGPMAALAFGTTNPYSGNLSLTYSQPLLRGFGREVTEARLQAAIEQAKGADENFRRRMMELLTLVDNLYWNQVYARQNLANKTIALELAKKHLQEDRDRIEAGMLARVELPQVQAAVAEWEKEVLAAEAMLMNAQAALLQNLFPDEGDRPPALNPVDPPEAGPMPVPLAEAKALALSHRPELAQAKYSLSANRTLEKAASNATLPQLDTQVAVIRDTSTYADVNGIWNDWSQARYPGYYVGLSFSYPIGNRARLARLSQAKAATRSSEYVVKDTKTTVGLDVEQAYTDLTTARKQVDAADAALAFRQESLDAEMEKLANGLSTSFFVLQRQSELDQARTSDLEARITAEKARTNLERAMGTLIDSAN